jgi:hypothetical protein
MPVSRKFRRMAIASVTLDFEEFKRKFKYYTINKEIENIGLLIRINNVAGHDNYLFRWACAEGYLGVVKYLINLPEKFGVDPSIMNNEAICSACGYGHLDVMKYLMCLPEKFGVDPSAWNNKAICSACRHGHLDVVKFLMSLPGKFGVELSEKK